MNYIIIEDIGSGYDFWSQVNERLLHNKARLYTCNGAYNFTNIIDRLKVKRGDKVTIILDYTDEHRMSLLDNMLKLKLKDKGVDYCIFKIYCFEEIILSYNKLDKWFLLEGEELRVYKLISDSLNNSLEYFTDSKIENYMNTKNLKCNREQFTANFLTSITFNTSFKTNKRILSKCWYEKCCHIENIYGAPNCLLYGNRLDSTQKLSDLLGSKYIKDRTDFKYLFADPKGTSLESINYKDFLLSKGYNIQSILNKYRELEFNDKVRGVDIFETVYFEDKYGESEFEGPSKTSDIKGF